MLTPGSCDDDGEVALDLAALSEGHLSPKGLHRVMRHAADCQTCQIALVQIILDDPGEMQFFSGELN